MQACAWTISFVIRNLSSIFTKGDLTILLRYRPRQTRKKPLNIESCCMVTSICCLIARDVTRVSQLEEMRKDFVANVSHELRTPLTVITGYLELLPSDKKDPFVSKALDEMHSQTARMQNLIEDLLTLSRIEASAERIFENSVDMHAMLRQIEAEASALNKDKQHHIQFDIDRSLQVFGVETELRSACSNLIFNAIHYTPSPGNIRVSWQETEQGARFAVTDNGDGIAAKHLARLTERFYRVDKARSRKTGGSGLGLSIVKHVLNHHNSHLEIESQVKQGSTFFVHAQ